ncbi:MAG: 1,6-anhydro-N-acetylmuramyl-L-alanine amidase AmpD [Acidiferrobacteraceae bacterium]|jgi:AmpD protein|nr:1,6-anhydro-N-acetylmuramyl-L-alanine amidase AmpD [Acidiferrobacteraceae bacterium]MDP6399248.1 1,6-anhydro-N-acetylmuramyl-L-alanine amidase AmpD [Arenicellales bacterium]MDP6551083.1 1,6-anhydro-N-acetylmuramyl-L-alanine amidase AmpD [Arenicellales bacterium]MDP6790883.1 1,6-anhydro-N-acetylmuramyl-L-alanine amidase AmpD [Arenicellales bacterium]MDP6918794.1 1,6-anhydro-N-acetylmuramyl-L-alanine amidase AmpD [Arenicellales bacterium]|tara:strand:+ start:216 stop:785 length:570 start_codon:yes stop_codon:yes gene_type:complete
MNIKPLEIDRETGLLSGSACLCSPHCDDRPEGVSISALVIHAISLPPGYFDTGPISDLFLGCLDADAHPYFREITILKVSTHFLIDREGEVTQFVPVIRRAWHAGNSFFGGRGQINDFSVGVELVGSDETRFTDNQYTTLASLTRALQFAWPAITTDRIVGHSDIAPGRKTDPGPHFDWPRYRRLLTSG